MPWRPSQQNRLVTEKSILEKFFPGRVQWIEPQGDTKVEVSLNTNNDHQYRVRIYLNDDFPNSLPDMICHSNAPHWTDRDTLYKVVMKGRLWLEAYEAYLETGACLSEYLVEMA
ncbi:uncharacterized protein LOC114527685 [Dendronephthya gigantea]|uniref:uncharacterized protein LOC114527685 n=1 Tax=Dendronephthya gigantea TaxID=151771 RepID=UPI00106CD050|nr:uncharacterized protein LOC114527685 [Dendronephthya gigantea]